MARQIGVPEAALQQTVRRFNARGPRAAMIPSSVAAATTISGISVIPTRNPIHASQQ